MRTSLWGATALAVFLGGAGCNDDPVPTSKKGELGAVTFDYGCSALSDPFCDGAKPGFPAGQFPTIAVGASFGLGSAVSLDSKRISGTTALLPGIAAMGDVFCTGQYPTDCPATDPLFLHDIVHVKIAAPMTLQVTHPDATGAYTEVFGTADFKFSIPDDMFRAVLVDDQGSLLAGAPPCVWTTSDPTVLTIQSDPSADIVSFHLTGKSGHSDLHVKLGLFDSTIPFDIN
jgi:hypothetical protein